MLVMYLVGQALWLTYGLMIGAMPLIAANALSIVIVCAVTFTKLARTRQPAAARRRLRIAIDMDEVMADAVSEHIRRYNAAFGAALTADQLRGRHLEDWAPRIQRDAVEAMYDASFFAALDVMPGCQDVVREL